MEKMGFAPEAVGREGGVDLHPTSVEEQVAD